PTPIAPPPATLTVASASPTVISAPATATILTTPFAPPPTAPPCTPGPSIPPTPTLEALSTSDRLDLFEHVWSLVDTRWVYTDFRGLNWSALHDEYRPKIQAAAAPQEVYSILTELI